MSRRKRSPEEQARREKIRELLQTSGISSMEDIQNLFKETIAEFMENGLDAELDDELGYTKYDYKNKNTDNSRNGHSNKTLRTSFGDVEVSVPRDRKGEFDPQLLNSESRNRKDGVICLRGLYSQLTIAEGQVTNMGSLPHSGFEKIHLFCLSLTYREAANT